MTALDLQYMIKIIVFCVALFGFGVMYGVSISTDESKRAAIEHHAAQYNPTTGNFEWLDK